MSMLTETQDVSRSIGSKDCALCGEPGQGIFDEDGQEFCCAGCRSAFDLLKEFEEARCSLETTRPSFKLRRSYEEMDDPVFRMRYVKVRPDELSEVTFVLEGLDCPSCLGMIERLPHYLAGLTSARLNLTRGTASFVWDDSRIPLSEIALTLKRLGFPPWPYERDQQSLIAQRTARHEMIQLAIAGACAGNVMLIAIALYAGIFSGMETAHLMMFRYVSAALGIVCVVGPGRVFFLNAIRAIKTRTPHMDMPVALGVGIGTIDGIVRTVWGTGDIYFDSIATLVFLLLTGRYLQSQQKRKAIDRVSMLRVLTPQTARVVRGEKLSVVPIDALRLDDLVEILPGETFPADGVLVNGESDVDQSLLTGESFPLVIQVGSPVIAGTINLTSPVRMIVEQLGHQTRLGQLLTLVEEAAAHKSPLVQLTDRIGGYFVVGVIILAITNMVIWWASGVEQAIEQTIALLIVACPCALGLATPLVISVFQGRAARLGILIKSGDAIERLADQGEIWLDKTGTVTTGEMELVEWSGDENLQPIVCAIEHEVSHPVAKAIVTSLQKRQKEWETSAALKINVTNLQVTHGLGVQAVYGEQQILVGSRKLMEIYQVVIPESFDLAVVKASSSGLTSVFIARDGLVVALATLGNTLRPGVESIVKSLNLSGWHVGLLSGDEGRVVQFVAKQIGVSKDRALGNATPEDKLQRVSQKGFSKTIVMVGDGVNDSAALVAADVGIAVEGGAEASMHAADIYLQRGDVTQLPMLLTACRRVMRRIWLNLVISLSYNILAVVLAMTGHIHPLMAAILMPISSLTVLSVAFAGSMFPRSSVNTTSGSRFATRTAL